MLFVDGKVECDLEVDNGATSRVRNVKRGYGMAGKKEKHRRRLAKKKIRM